MQTIEENQEKTWTTLKKQRKHLFQIISDKQEFMAFCFSNALEPLTMKTIAKN